ncbi:angiopoietin-related protein 7-like [Drosophila albomicans]|uniref:Angiopoietin-related protein 7-like n=1 Tax=Drosophila albomicans TaxID=7291 RepID=A0A6P8XIC4_DROAB|nr:angiopoietin-related protein 7-like [Drosophila albomicans]
MGKFIILVALTCTVFEISLASTTTEDASLPFKQRTEEQPGSVALKIVKPLLEYYQLTNNESERSDLSDRELKVFNETLFHQEIIKSLVNELRSASDSQKGTNEVLISEYRSQISFQKELISKLINNTKTNESVELVKKWGECECQLKVLSSNIIEKDSEIEKLNFQLNDQKETQKAIQLQLEDTQRKLVKTEKAQKSYQTAIDNLIGSSQEDPISSCIPFENYPGVHQITVPNADPFNVLCDSKTAGKGWIVIQQRIGENETNFNRDWVSYRQGFGSLDGDFFLGLDKIYSLTQSEPVELYVHLVGLDGEIKYAQYDNFQILDNNNNFILKSLGNFTGNVSDALKYAEGMPFSTFDRDNDAATHNCADVFIAGWWYRNCFDSNLNSIGVDLNWNIDMILNETKMLIRPKTN